MAGRRHSRIVDLAKEGDPLVDGIITAHANHSRSMDIIRVALQQRGLDATWRHNIEDLDTDDYDLVITVGGDGTVLHTSHSVGSTPILPINSSPATSVGYLTAGSVESFSGLFDQIVAGLLRPIKLTRMRVKVNEKTVTNRALNDVLFCHTCPASTTRYVIILDDQTEAQLSSGIWVATAAGSTAAIKSSGGRVMRPGSKRLQFMVRESYPLVGEEKKPTLISGFVNREGELTVRSKSDTANLYVDGPHELFPVEFGDVISFSRSEESLYIFGYTQKAG